MKKNIRDVFSNFSPDTVILFAETALITPECEKLAEEYIDHYFQRNNQVGQMLVRAYLIKARLVAINGDKDLLKGEQAVENLQKSLS